MIAGERVGTSTRSRQPKRTAAKNVERHGARAAWIWACRSTVPCQRPVEFIEALGQQRTDEVIPSLVGDQQRSCDRIAQRLGIFSLNRHAP
ncbi:hypothetical protein [Sphingomonas sp. PP-CE-3G-477]|uniref:hypothetical protein n=1 Tax=Sphingomonas sp. PP-CE-3G-477 TaxID=2135660 RepID=UPI000D33EBF6|nr:hypothetical protein [Sphingomonas sp. PP-CE-3G-477]